MGRDTNITNPVNIFLNKKSKTFQAYSRGNKNNWQKAKSQFYSTFEASVENRYLQNLWAPSCKYYVWKQINTVFIHVWCHIPCKELSVLPLLYILPYTYIYILAIFVLPSLQPRCLFSDHIPQEIVSSLTECHRFSPGSPVSSHRERWQGN